MGNQVSIEQQKLENEREKMRLAAEIEKDRIFGAVTVSGKRLLNSPKVHDDIIYGPYDYSYSNYRYLHTVCNIRMIPTVKG